jgi:hypothetical protein
VEKLDALWTVGQVTVEAFPFLSWKTSTQVVHAVVNQLLATDADNSLVGLHNSASFAALGILYS